MTTGKRRPQRTLLEIALRGGAAGVAGGLAVALFEREILARITGGAPHRSAWDRLAAKGVSRLGVRVGGRGKIATGVVSQLAYAGVLGAVYAVLHEQARDSRGGRILIDGAMAYAASLVFPDRPVVVRRGRKLPLRRKVVDPVDPATAFASVTAMVLGAVTR